MSHTSYFFAGVNTITVEYQEQEHVLKLMKNGSLLVDNEKYRFDLTHGKPSIIFDRAGKTRHAENKQRK